ELLAEGARCEIAPLEERPQRLQMRRDDRLATAAGHQGEQRRYDQNAALTGGLHQRRELARQRRDRRMALAGAALGAVRMQEVVLQVAKDQRARCRIHAASTMRLPSASMRPASPGSITVVASGCSRIAGPSMRAPAGRSSRDQIAVSRKPPAN